MNVEPSVAIPELKLASRQPPTFHRPLGIRKFLDRLFEWLTLIATFLGLIVLVVLLWDVLQDGLPRLNWQFLTSFPSRKPEEAGILSALVGSLWLLGLTALIAFPIGVGAGIYLEEYAPDNRLTQLIEINIANLAGVPSIIYGLLGLEIFVRFLFPVTGGRSVLSGALTMSLLILPVIIIATREALRAVPDTLRQAGYALGATRWQVIRDQVLPLAFPGILTGTILALSRAIGETAPLITIGALTYIAFLPPLGLEGLRSPFTVLPIQIFNWVSRPQKGFHINAAAGIIVLLAVLLSMNSIAIVLRNKYQRRLE
ncbi:MAG: phosphate ABC transporter permease PstA [Anaerolineae bacterium]|nr:phosphate ABC transporter permease PstA [Anaerolineae bacterium]MDW8098519.1 phosphate ABC transporter permease PstA [Anaerolineae bacterium]